jgi:hypothetical protein
MLKLYKRGRKYVHYWEAWEHSHWIVVHEGKLGERGKVRYLPRGKRKSAERRIAEAAKEPRAKGYAEIPRDEQHTVIVQYRLKGWGSPEDLQKGHRIEGLFNECLGWTGNGRCDGNDFGSGTMNIFSIVVDPDLGATTMVDELRKHRFLKGAVVAVREGEEYRVVYPARFKGKFSLF